MNKHDTYVNTGQSAAYYNDKVYFVSQEKGISGLYSMNDDGSGLKFEFTIPKITRITINNEGYYYVGLKSNEERKVKEDKEKKHFFYSFYRVDKTNNNLEELKYSDRLEYDESVADGFILDNGTIIIREVGYIYNPYGRRYIETFTITENSNDIVGFSRYGNIDEYDGTDNSENRVFTFDIVRHNGYLESYDNYPHGLETPEPAYKQGKLVLDEDARTNVFNSFVDIEQISFSMMKYACLSGITLNYCTQQTVRCLLQKTTD